jgi:hypothetical protein
VSVCGSWTETEQHWALASPEEMHPAFRARKPLACFFFLLYVLLLQVVQPCILSEQLSLFFRAVLQVSKNKEADSEEVAETIQEIMSKVCSKQTQEFRRELRHAQVWNDIGVLQEIVQKTQKKYGIQEIIL